MCWRTKHRKLPWDLEQFGKHMTPAHCIGPGPPASSWNGQVPTGPPAWEHSLGQWAQTDHKYIHTNCAWVLANTQIPPERDYMTLLNVWIAHRYQTKEIMQINSLRGRVTIMHSYLWILGKHLITKNNYLPLLVLSNDQSNTSSGCTWMWLFVQNYIYTEEVQGQTLQYLSLVICKSLY